MDWVRTLDKKSSERRIHLWAQFSETLHGFTLTLTDEDGHSATVKLRQEKALAKDPERNQMSLREHLGKFGSSHFALLDIGINIAQAWFVPASALNQLRRDALEALELERARNYQRPTRAKPVEPPAPYPEDALSYLANVYNHKAHDFYAKHGVKVIDAAYESQEELGEVSLMITKHCVRFSMSLCPKQAKGVTGVQGTVRAEPLQLINGKEKLTLRFDCKPCEMHVVGRMKKSVLNQRDKLEGSADGVPMKFYRTKHVALN